MKHVVARATTYLVVALLLVLALRFSPEIPERPAAGVLHSADSAQTDSALLAAPPPAPAPSLSRTERLQRGETLIGLL